MPAIGERRYRVLRLGDRHAVARGDDDLAGVCEELGDSLGVDGVDLALVLRRPACARGRGVRAEAAEDDRGEGPVHRLAHDPGQVGARGAHEGPGGDEQRVAQHEAGGRRRPPGVRVEHGDDDGHVASADRGDEVEPERERDDRHEQERDPRQRGALLDAQEDDHEEGADDERPEVERVATRQREGSALDPRGKLEVGDDRARERDAADEDAEEDLAEVEGAERSSLRAGRDEGVVTDEDGRQSDEGVQHRAELRHPGHLDAARQRDADRRTDEERDRDEESRGDDASARPGGQGERDRRGQRDRHADGAEGVTAPGRLMPGQTGERHDEQERRDEVRQARPT